MLDKMSGLHMKVSTGILARLGEELTPDPDQGIMELVRNAYDADATECRIEILGEQGKTSVIISDNGVGMDVSGIDLGWLVLGKSKKAEHRLTPKGRVAVGDKGLGRLAALRMGKEALLVTRPANQPGTQYEIMLDWPKFDAADFLEDVDLDIQSSKTTKGPGTEIFVTEIGNSLSRKDIERLARHILLMADPFDDSLGFRPTLIAPAFTDLEKKVQNAYFDDAEYHLVASLNDKFLASASVLDWKGNIVWHTDNLGGEYKAPPTSFDLWVFLLRAKTFSTRNATVSEAREWLKVVGGVHLYHRQLRVRPYGDAGHDWLEMNLSRAKSPEERPSTNTSIGRIVVKDLDSVLMQKTDRMGFVENEAFHELKRFAKDSLDWMARMRLKDAETRRETDKQNANKEVTKGKDRITEFIDKEVASDKQEVLKQAFEQFEKALERQTKTLREDLQLYRSLATAGTTSAVFAHEATKPATQIEKLSSLIRRRGTKEFGEPFVRILSPPLELISKSAQSLRSFASLPLFLLKREKRRAEIVDIHKILSDILTLFGTFLSDSKVVIETDFVDETAKIRGSVALAEAIFANIITNAINAFKVNGARVRGRKILITTSKSGPRLVVRFLDNGLGIRDIDIAEIWLPGRTTFSDGTGFGLTIVRDAAQDLGGKVHAIACGELGGAEFIVEFPLGE